MAWNRPSEKKVEVEGRGRQWNVHLKGLAAGMIVVIGAGIVAWWLWPTAEPQTSNLKPQTSSRIKEVKPAAVKTNAVDVAKRPAKKLDPKDDPNVFKPLRSGGKDSPEVAEMRRKHPLRKCPFTAHSEIMISGMLETKPGDFYIERNFGPEFIEDLKASMTNKIVIRDTDPPDVADEKAQMIEIKEHFNHLFNLGLDQKVVQELEEAQNQLTKARQNRDYLKAEFDKLESDPNADPLDVMTFHDAANKILQEKGISPIESAYVTRLKRQQLREERRAKRLKRQKEEIQQ